MTERVIYYQETGTGRVLWQSGTTPANMIHERPIFNWSPMRLALEAVGYRFIPTDFSNPDPQDRRWV